MRKMLRSQLIFDKSVYNLCSFACIVGIKLYTTLDLVVGSCSRMGFASNSSYLEHFVLPPFPIDSDDSPRGSFGLLKAALVRIKNRNHIIRIVLKEYQNYYIVQAQTLNYASVLQRIYLLLITASIEQKRKMIDSFKN